MHSKSDPPLELFAGTRLPDLLRVYLEFNRLKQLYRKGWLERGLAPERCESVAEHSFAVALLALLLADACHPALDRDRLLRMALLHDFGEIHAGDLTPGDGVPKAEKRRREAASVARVLGTLPGGEVYLDDLLEPVARSVDGSGLGVCVEAADGTVRRSHHKARLEGRQIDDVEARGSGTVGILMNAVKIIADHGEAVDPQRRT